MPEGYRLSLAGMGKLVDSLAQAEDRLTSANKALKNAGTRDLGSFAIDKAGANFREQVRAMLQQQWRESVAVTYFRLRRVDFAVPGRSNPVATVFLWIVLIIFIIPLILLHLIAEVFGFESWFGPASKRGKVFVKGGRDCIAQTVGDAVRNAGPHLWLAWSHNNMAFVAAEPGRPGRILWHAVGPQRPRLKATGVVLAWPDESTLTFELTEAERTRTQSRNGRP